MKPFPFTLLCILALARVLSADAASPASPPPAAPLTVAILDFESRPELGTNYGAELAALVTAQLSIHESLMTVERAELAKLLSEQELGVNGTVAPETAAKVGQLTGAKVLVTGRAFRAGNQLVAVAKVMGTETGRVFGEISRGGLDTPVTQLSDDLARRVAALTTQHAAALVAPQRPLTNRIEEIRRRLPNGPRPSVRVQLPEHHRQGPIPDPAAETELRLILQELGCTILSSESSQRPALEITGEAFSETAGRRGSLISVKARVEVVVRDHATGQILASDRQVSVAVDTAEHIAAKQALAEAAATLAERILPKVIR